MRLHIVVHESFESPGAIKDWAKEKGHIISYSRVYAGEALPTHCAGFDFLIIMGGPQSPATTTEECPYFNAKQEIAFIKQAIDANKLVLGVCLGAQLIGEALGAQVAHSPHKEIGAFNITLTEDARKDPLFADFPQQFLVSHWHSDMPGLTSDAKVLATSEGCPRQIIKYASGIYGFQCHFEFTLETIEQMITHCGCELENSPKFLYIQDAEMLRQNNYHSANQLLFKFLNAIQEQHELNLQKSTINMRKEYV